MFLWNVGEGTELHGVTSQNNALLIVCKEFNNNWRNVKYTLPLYVPEEQVTGNKPPITSKC
jgi:hypothetical protein